MADTTQSKPSKTYAGNCHCGAIKYEATISPALDDGNVASNCNCSICTRNGYHFVYTPKSTVVFKSGGEDKMTSYKFGKERIAHYFCPTCGTSVFAQSVDPTFFPDMWAVNVRTFKDINMDDVQLKKLDGKAFEPEYTV